MIYIRRLFWTLVAFHVVAISFIIFILIGAILGGINGGHEYISRFRNEFAAMKERVGKSK